MSFNPLAYPLCLGLPARVQAIAWQEHIPFATALIQMLRPKVFVELGVHAGDSYLAICQAASALGTGTACYGVDTWKGDPQAGFYGEEVLATLRTYHDPLYGGFSQLMQCTFDEAAGNFADGSVSLLHIDGLHLYQAVKHDWETWRPKLSRGGVVLFHDINVRERDFGVWKLWEEIRNLGPSFEFEHGHGLGLLIPGGEVPAGARELLDLNRESIPAVREFFFALGNRITLKAQIDVKDSLIKRLEARVLEYDGECRARDRRIKELDDKINEYDSVLRARIKDQEDRQRSEMERRLALERELLDARSQLTGAMNSRSYKIGRFLTAPWRWLREMA